MHMHNMCMYMHMYMLLLLMDGKGHKWYSPDLRPTHRSSQSVSAGGDCDLAATRCVSTRMHQDQSSPYSTDEDTPLSYPGGCNYSVLQRVFRGDVRISRVGSCGPPPGVASPATPQDQKPPHDGAKAQGSFAKILALLAFAKWNG